jgi:peptidyl-tRNA hydrolase
MMAGEFQEQRKRGQVWLLGLVITGALVGDNFSHLGGILLAVGGVLYYGMDRWRLQRAWMARYRGVKLKQYCIFSKEALDQMKGVRGKMITQGGHGYVHAYWDSLLRFPLVAASYRGSQRAFKITLVVPTEAELIALEAKYRERCGVSLVKDAGLTVFKNDDGSPKPTITCLGLGPVHEIDLDEDVTGLRTLT